LKQSSVKEIGVIDQYKPTGEKVRVVKRGHFPNTAMVALAEEHQADTAGVLTEVYISDLKGSYAASNK
jgi:hypothetical protein